jgi:hypothetical protein
MVMVNKNNKPHNPVAHTHKKRNGKNNKRNNKYSKKNLVGGVLSDYLPTAVSNLFVNVGDIFSKENINDATNKVKIKAYILNEVNSRYNANIRFSEYENLLYKLMQTMPESKNSLRMIGKNLILKMQLLYKNLFKSVVVFKEEYQPEQYTLVKKFIIYKFGNIFSVFNLLNDIGFVIIKKNSYYYPLTSNQILSPMSVNFKLTYKDQFNVEKTEVINIGNMSYSDIKKYLNDIQGLPHSEKIESNNVSYEYKHYVNYYDDKSKKIFGDNKPLFTHNIKIPYEKMFTDVFSRTEMEVFSKLTSSYLSNIFVSDLFTEHMFAGSAKISSVAVIENYSISIPKLVHMVENELVVNRPLEEIVRHVIAAKTKFNGDGTNPNNIYENGLYSKDPETNQIYGGENNQNNMQMKQLNQPQTQQIQQNPQQIQQQVINQFKQQGQNRQQTYETHQIQNQQQNKQQMLQQFQRRQEQQQQLQSQTQLNNAPVSSNQIIDIYDNYEPKVSKELNSLGIKLIHTLKNQGSLTINIQNAIEYNNKIHINIMILFFYIINHPEFNDRSYYEKLLSLLTKSKSQSAL